MAFVKRGYVAAVRAARPIANSIGLISALERAAQRHPAARWGRSLFAIHDIDDMVQLDLPWWTMDAIDKVDAFLRVRPRAQVFEYGSGASTIWLAKRSGSVKSVEHDNKWYPIVREKLANFSNAELTLVSTDPVPHPDPAYLSQRPGWRGRTFHDYVHAIDRETGEFDMIVIDGRARPACLAHAARRLAKDGLIVFDNTRRAAYREAIAASGLQAYRSMGLAACLPDADETTLLRKSPV